MICWGLKGVEAEEWCDVFCRVLEWFEAEECVAMGWFVVGRGAVNWSRELSCFGLGWSGAEVGNSY